MVTGPMPPPQGKVTEGWRAVRSSRWVHFDSSPGAIIGASKWSWRVMGPGQRVLIAQGVRELGKSLPPGTKNVFPMSSRGSWMYSSRKKKLKIQRQQLFLGKVPSYQMLKAVRMFENVKLDPCAAPLLFLGNLQNLHLWLMETKHCTGLCIHPEWLFPHLS